MSKSTQKYTYTMPTEQYEEMQRFVEANGFRSVSSFVCRAVSLRVLQSVFSTPLQDL